MVPPERGAAGERRHRACATAADRGGQQTCGCGRRGCRRIAGRGSDYKVDLTKAPRGLHAIIAFDSDETRIVEQARGRDPSEARDVGPCGLRTDALRGGMSVTVRRWLFIAVCLYSQAIGRTGRAGAPGSFQLIAHETLKQRQEPADVIRQLHQVTRLVTRRCAFACRAAKRLRTFPARTRGVQVVLNDAWFGIYQVLSQVVSVEVSVCCFTFGRDAPHDVP